MAQQDYILRLIEQMGSALAQLRRMILGGEIKSDQAASDLHEVAGRVGVDLDLLQSVDLDTLLMLMSPGGEPEPGRCWLTAEMFLVEGLRLEAAGEDEDAWLSYERALRLFAVLDPGIVARGFPEVRDRISEVKDLMDRLAEGTQPE